MKNASIYRRWIFLIIVFFVKTQINAQRNLQVNYCGQNSISSFLELLNINEKNKLLLIENSYEIFYQNKIKVQNKRSKITLPVVIHIIHNNGPENISDIQAQNAIQYLNDAFQNQGYFNSTDGIDTEIEFCLARRTPFGDSTTGIIRYQSPSTDMSLSMSAKNIIGMATWDPKKYINIRIVKDVCLNGTCIPIGYGTYPALAELNEDGIFIEADYFGKSETNTSALVHEMGHYLGLLHTFEGGCKNDNCLIDGDKVCDTPPDNITGSYPCFAKFNSCKSDEDDSSSNNPFRSILLGGLGDQADKHRNFMDYSAFDCYNQFTLGQKDRIHFFLSSLRKGLLESVGCQLPCAQKVTAKFSIDSQTVKSGTIVNCTNASINADGFLWHVNDTLLGQNTNFSYQFFKPGTYFISLKAIKTNDFCDTALYVQQVTVVCPVIVDFIITLGNDKVIFENTSLFADSITWLIKEGSSISYSSNQNIDSFQLDKNLEYLLCLIAWNQNCKVQKCIFIQNAKDSVEICNNEIDDDYDGLIDSFDPDCPCSSIKFEAICPVNCEYIPNNNSQINLKLKWKTEVITDSSRVVNNIVVGDGDNDGEVEVISNMLFQDPFNILKVYPSFGIFNGKDGSVKKIVFTGKINGFGNEISFADCDKDSFAEFYYTALDSIVCLNFDGLLKYKSKKLPLPNGFLLNIADFNGDGKSELYLGNLILNAETGKVLLDGKNGSRGCNLGNIFSDCFLNHTIAADLLPTPGLELACGNTVYSIFINNVMDSIGNILIPSMAESKVLDGFTSVGDIDGDGLLDVISVRSNEYPDGGGIWVWNPRDGLIIAEANAGILGGVAFVGDVIGDCKPEIGIVFRNELRMYVYDGTKKLKLLYALPVNEYSGHTGMTMFDFNQDGKNEIVYRDETSLMIIEGSSGKILTSTPMYSITAMENPIVADVDQDGQADILVNGYLANKNENRIYCFESAGAPWAPARSVWNQPGYHVTNVNDDLTIPRHEQNNAIALLGSENCVRPTCSTPYNTFMAQATYRTQEGCVQFPASDMSLELLDYACTPDSLIFYLVIQQIHPLTDTGILKKCYYVSCYPYPPDNNSSPLETICYQFPFDSITGQYDLIDTIRVASLIPPGVNHMYFVVNDPGTGALPSNFDKTGIIECNYQNNIDSIKLDIEEKTLDLGPDIIKCQSEVIHLNAGSAFESYIWNNNTTDSTYSFSDAGLHFVITEDHCHRLYSDSVFVTLDTVGNVQLGTDITTCPGTTQDILIDGTYDDIQWFPPENVSCDSCKQTQIQSDTTVTILVVAGKGNCYSADTLEIIVKPIIQLTDSFDLCEGQQVEYMDSLITQSGIYSIPLNHCDSVIILNVKGHKNDTTTVNTIICTGDSIFFANQWLKKPGIYSTTLQGTHLCDSIVLLDLIVSNMINTNDSIQLCPGDSIYVNNQWIKSSIILVNSYVSSTGCDSVHHISISIQPLLQLKDSMSICTGDSIHLGNQWITQAGLYTDTIPFQNCKAILQTWVTVFQKSEVNDYFQLCPGDSVYINNQWWKDTGQYQFPLKNMYQCDSIYTIHITSVKVPNAPEAKVNCKDLFIDVSINADMSWSIEWDNGDTTFHSVYHHEDIAQVTLKYNTMCTFDYILNLPELPIVSELPQLKDTTINPGEFISINLNLDPVEWKVQWEPGEYVDCDTCMQVQLNPQGTTEFSVKYFHSSGCIYQSKFVIQEKNESTIFIPNVFSPNNDGVNDQWVVYSLQPIIIESAQIFNRWGDQLAEWNHVQNISWDGKFHGKSLNPDVYVFTILIRDQYNKLRLMKGDITLLK